MIVPLEQDRVYSQIDSASMRTQHQGLLRPPANRYFVPETAGAWAHGRQHPHLPSRLETSPRGTHEAFDLWQFNTSTDFPPPWESQSSQELPTKASLARQIEHPARYNKSELH